MTKTIVAVFLGWAALALSGCATGMRPGLSDQPIVSELKQPRVPANGIGWNDAGNDEYIGVTEPSMLVSMANDDSDPLPATVVPKFSLAGVSLYEAVRVIAQAVGMSVSIVGDSPGAQVMRRNISTIGTTGDLGTVLDNLSQSAGFYWRYKNNTIYIEPDRQYITNVPPVNDLFESLPYMIKTLGGTDVMLDKSVRVITFRATRDAFQKIEGYLRFVRENRALIVYDTFIWEVVLNDESRLGINWQNTPLDPKSITNGAVVPSNDWGGTVMGGITNSSTVANGVSVALGFIGKKWNFSTLLDFLRTQGTVNALSQPRVQILSGGKATLKDEKQTTYVSKIAPSILSGGTVVPGATETASITTGLVVSLTGDISDGTIYTDIGVRISDMITMDEQNAGGTTIKLPQTSFRETNISPVRCKPGDMILLAGIQYDKVTKSRSGFPNGIGGLLMTTSKGDIMARSELVIVLQPRIRRFAQPTRSTKAMAGTGVVDSGEHKQKPTSEAPSPVVPQTSATALRIEPVGRVTEMKGKLLPAQAVRETTNGPARAAN